MMELPSEITYLHETFSTEAEKIISWGYCNAFIEQDHERKSMNPEKNCFLVFFLKNSSERYYRLLVIEKLMGQVPTIIFETKLPTRFRSREIQIDNQQPETIIMNINAKLIGLKFIDSDECLKFYENVPKRLENPFRLKEHPTPRPRSVFNNVPQRDDSDGLINLRNLEVYQNRNAISLTEDQEEIYEKLSCRLKMKGPNEVALVKQILVKNEDALRRSFRIGKKKTVVLNEANFDAQSVDSFEIIGNSLPDLSNDRCPETKSVSPDRTEDIQTEPKNKIVINAPFSIRQSYYMNVVNSSSNQISYTVKSTNPNVLTVYPSVGVLDKGQNITFTLDFNPKHYPYMGVEMDYLIIDWINTIDEERQRTSEGFEIPFRIKTLRIEYNS